MLVHKVQKFLTLYPTKQENHHRICSIVCDVLQLISQIENKLAIIARQGRAFGIHLILATQRPDANILPGQIRNNIDFRVCGRADTVLSQIILDNTKAADEIPKHTQGRFITHDGKVFQGYMYDESTI